MIPLPSHTPFRVNEIKHLFFWNRIASYWERTRYRLVIAHQHLENRHNISFDILKNKACTSEWSHAYLIVQPHNIGYNAVYVLHKQRIHSTITLTSSSSTSSSFVVSIWICGRVCGLCVRYIYIYVHLDNVFCWFVERPISGFC